MDREIMGKLFEATTDDASKVPDTVTKPICKAAVKSKEPALRDMAGWLVDRLVKNDSCQVKIKVVRVVMQMIASPKAIRFGEIFKELGVGEIEKLTEFECEPDDVHGDKPQEFVRSLAVKCLMVLQAFEAPSAGGGGMMEKAKAARAKVEAAASEAKHKVEAVSQEALAAAGAAAANAKSMAHEAIDSPKDSTAPIKAWAPARGTAEPNGPTHLYVRWAMPPEDLSQDPEFELEVKRGLTWNSVSVMPEVMESGGRPQWTAKISSLEADKRYSIRVRVSGGGWSESSEPIATTAFELGDGAVAEGVEPEPEMSKTKTETLDLKFGDTVEALVESRSRLVYAITVVPEDHEVKWNIEIAAYDLACGVTFAAGGAPPRAVNGWNLTKQEAGKVAGSFTITEPGVLAIELDNSYSRMRAKNAKVSVFSVGASITVVPCRWDMGQGEWDPFLKKALANPVFVELSPFKLRMQQGVTWDEIIDSISTQTHADWSEITIVGSSSRRGAAYVPFEFPGDEHLAVVNMLSDHGRSRSRVLSAAEVDKLDSEGACGVFSDPAATQCSSDEVPAILLSGQATVQLQLPTTAGAWSHHESESQPAAETAAEGTQTVSITDTKVEAGKTFYEVSWSDKRGRKHVVWKRYSRFDILRSDLAKLRKEVKELPFPKKKLKGSKKDKTVDERVEKLQQFLHQLVVDELVLPQPWEEDGKILFAFLTGESDL
jgi:hypothetical protein